MGHISFMLETFTALAEANRLRIVELLLDGPQSVGIIGEKLDLKQPQVSKHLRVLKEARLVEVQTHAQQRVYELSPEPLRELNAWLQRYRKLWDARFAAMDTVLEELKAQESADLKSRTNKKVHLNHGRHKSTKS